MKLVVERNALAAAIGRVGKCVGKGTNHPIIGNILLRAEGDGLVLSGTDLDMVASARLHARIATPGAATVPAKMFTDIVTRTPDGAALSIECESERAMVLRTGRSRILLQTLPAADFPDLPIGEAVTHRFAMPAKDLSRLLDRVDFAISREETRVYLCGVFLHRLEREAGAVLCGVTTDGHRLALQEIAAPEGSEAMPDVIVPTKTVAELIRIGKDVAGDVGLGLCRGALVADFADGTRLTSKLIEGTFPDYRRLLPDNPKRVTLDRDAVTESAARLAAVAQDTSILLTFSTDRLQLVVNNPAAGEAVDEMEADWPHEDLSIRFSAGYLRDTLAALTGDHFEARLDTPGSPTLFVPASDPSLTLLLMPRSM